MTIRYNYVCSNCGAEYKEQRTKEESQYIVNCAVCKNGKYNLVNDFDVPKFAVIENNVVVNLVTADTREEAEFNTGLLCVQYTDDVEVKIGDKFMEDKPSKKVK
jgi:DNA-directed RNA polymerase subunit RPC12/RpoP